MRCESVGGAGGGGESYWINAAAVLHYLLKCTDMEAGEALGQAWFGEAGRVIGKRMGFTQNIGDTRYQRQLLQCPLTT